VKVELETRLPVANARILDALDVLIKYGSIDGAHHKTWVIDQAIEKLLGPEQYKVFVAECEKAGYGYEHGIAP
jgi:hypothetical protein